MAKWCDDDNMDAMLNRIKNNTTRISLCTAQPTTYAEATTTYDGGASKYKLAIATISSTDFTGPADGDSSGRKLTVNEVVGMTIDASETANYIALSDSSNSELLYVTTCTAQVLTAGNTVTIPAWKITVTDPS